MSHSFYVRNVNKLSYQDTLDKVGINNLLLTEDSPRPENNSWPVGESYLYIDQASVRPIETSYNGTTFSARIFANSSPEDYDLAIKLIAEIAKQNDSEVEAEDSSAMDVDSFLKQYDTEWIREHSSSMLSMLITSYQQEQAIFTLSGTVRNLKAGPRFFGQLLADPKNVFNEFHKRFRILNYLENHDFFIANGIRLQNNAGDLEVTTSVYGPDVDTILSDSVDVITVRCDNNESYFLTLDQLAEALGDQATWLSENIMLAKAVKEEDWKRLIDLIKPVASTDIFDFGGPPEEGAPATDTSYRSKFTDEQWLNILYSPIVTFALVAGADGKIDKKEAVGFRNQLIQGLAVDNAMLQEVMVGIIPEVGALMNEVIGGGVDPKAVLENVASSVDANLCSDDAMHFKLSLLQIGKAIAESSGGFMGMFGSRISKEETRALAAMALLLNLGTIH